jgi:hypothetical protein
MKTKLESDALHTVGHDSAVPIIYQGEMSASHYTLLCWMENRVRIFWMENRTTQGRKR